MAKLLRRLALVATLAACAVGMFTASAQARTAFAGGAGKSAGTRSLAYVQPLNETENGVAQFFFEPPFGCGVFAEGGVSGSPISNGEFISILFVDCAGTEDNCLEAGGIVEMADGSGEIEKEESGTLCVTIGSDAVTVAFTGTYTIVGGFGAYSGATGSGASTKTFNCDLDGSCEMTGHEGAAGEEGPIKKGNDPTHVLLCSPVLVQRSDGTMGNALQVPWADYQAWLTDATSHPEIPTGSIPAKYAQDVGLTCDNLPGYKDSGKKADEQGTVPDDQTGPLEGAIYPYWIKL